MAKGKNQKLKLLYLARILEEKTDDNHGMSMPEMIEELKKHDIESERKSLYDDLEVLKGYGMDIESEKIGRTTYYSVCSKQFEIAELKMLVDAIQSSNFITAKKSNELIKKLESCASEYEAKQLQRQVYVTGRVKTMNESIYYNVDAIHAAITDNRQIKFKYFRWNYKKEEELRRGGEDYVISPWAMLWEDDNYYIVGFDEKEDIMKHFRVDKMKHICETEDERKGAEMFKNVDLASYNQKYFGMYRGDDQMVNLEFHNSLANVVIDRFGKDYTLIPTDQEHFKMGIKVSVSAQFFGWLVGLGDQAKILEPLDVQEKFKEHLKKINSLYDM